MVLERRVVLQSVAAVLICPSQASGTSAAIGGMRRKNPPPVRARVWKSHGRDKTPKPGTECLNCGRGIRPLVRISGAIGTGKRIGFECVSCQLTVLDSDLPHQDNHSLGSIGGHLVVFLCFLFPPERHQLIHALSIGRDHCVNRGGGADIVARLQIGGWESGREGRWSHVQVGMILARLPIAATEPRRLGTKR